MASDTLSEEVLRGIIEADAEIEGPMSGFAQMADEILRARARVAALEASEQSMTLALHNAGLADESETTEETVLRLIARVAELERLYEGALKDVEEYCDAWEEGKRRIAKLEAENERKEQEIVRLRSERPRRRTLTLAERRIAALESAARDLLRDLDIHGTGSMGESEDRLAALVRLETPARGDDDG